MKKTTVVMTVITTLTATLLLTQLGYSFTNESNIGTLLVRSPNSGVGPFPQGPDCDNIPSNALLPNMQSVIPKHLQIQNDHQREYLRFSNGIANTGSGNWQMIPIFPEDPNLTQDAAQQFLDSDGNIICQETVSQTQFHPAHNHWHMADIAKFSIVQDNPENSEIVGSIKVSFCLIDWYNMDGNSNTKERTYFDCERGMQGIQVGWVDQYHQELPGQELEITDFEPGVYFLVSEVNHEKKYIESNSNDNVAWIQFLLTRDSNGNAKIIEGATSDCTTGIPEEYQEAMCGEIKLNR
jgi:hypothetical protein